MAGVFSIAALDKKATALAFAIGLATILAAWASQIWGGLVPCELCLGERLPYYWGLPILALVLVLWNRLPRTVWFIAMLIAAAIFVWSVYLGAFHAGVEWKFWPGPTACTSSGSGLDLNQLNDLNAVKVVQCDQIQWQFLGISLAGYNALVSLLIVALLALALLDQYRRARRPAAA